ncbi:MAG: hypothetical protein HY399_00360 [Elusimicrobia bacterium]|nr:hypothetical protein [Elusimicrobiota bacterium]
MPERKKILLGITGSIAAYKSCELVRRLTEKKFETRCVLTPSAQHFVTPLTLGTLSGNPVYQNLHDPALWEMIPLPAGEAIPAPQERSAGGGMSHLSLATWADLVLVAPSSADFIARLAQGRAEGLLDSLILATRVPVVICPAMDEEMWLHPATQKNVEQLKSIGYLLWGPQKGPLASGKIGLGRLMEVENIVELVEKKLSRVNSEPVAR